MSFYDALKDHRIFCNQFLEGLDIMVVKIDPTTQRMKDNPVRNTKTQVWLECGPVRKGKTFSYTHDIDLDCGGDTFEQAIVELAKRVRGKYGD